MFKTKEEFIVAIRRYFDTKREEAQYTGFVGGAADCSGVDCGSCIFHNTGACPASNTFEVIEKLYQWAQEHPIVTYADKHKEVFGVDVSSYCPMDLLGLLTQEECNNLGCSECKSKYWNMEYKKPEAE